MDKKKRKAALSSYTPGSWNAYNLEEYTGPHFITPSNIVRGMKVFEQHFKMDLEIICGSQLLFWTLNLEERHDTRATRSQQRLLRKVPIRIYKFAVCSDEKLLFCNKFLPVKMQQHLMKALSCTGVKLLKLKGGDPINLLMMYRQSKRHSPQYLKLQHEEHLASLMDNIQHCGLMGSEDLSQELSDAARNKVLQKLGSSDDMIPCLQRISLSISNVPPDETQSLRDFHWSHVEMEVYAPSVFHLYKETGVVPEWLEKVRISGKAEVEARYA